MSNNSIKTLTLATGAALALTLAGSAFADQANPFSMTEIGHSTTLASAADGKCGQAKCGANKPKPKMEEGKCGGNKSEEAKCGANKSKEGKCGSSKPKMEEGKCGANK